MDAHCPLAGVQGGPLDLLVKKTIRLFCEAFPMFKSSHGRIAQFPEACISGKTVKMFIWRR